MEAHEIDVYQDVLFSDGVTNYHRPWFLLIVPRIGDTLYTRTMETTGHHNGFKVVKVELALSNAVCEVSAVVTLEMWEIAKDPFPMTEEKTRAAMADAGWEEL